MHPLSVIIIALNAEETIRDCLESIKWASELVILDSGSTDNTLAICKEYTDIVVSTDWPGFGAQKNRALAYATQPWVLSLDADEVLTENLQKEIQQIITSPTFLNAYRVRRRSVFIGKIIFYGDWGNDIVTRLFRRECGQFTDNIIHESLKITAPLGLLTNILIHNTATSIESCLEKLNRYTTLGAQKMLIEEKKSCMVSAYLHAAWSFIRSYFIKLGFLDGKEGYLIALLASQSSFYKHIKCSYLWREKK